MTVIDQTRLTGRLALHRIWVAAVAVALIQTVILGYMIESRAAILRNGSEVLLKTAAVDPRDLLRGDYVTLNYDISSVPTASLVGGLPTSASGNVLSVRLQKQEDGFWGVAESSFGVLEPRDGTVVLKTEPLAYLPIAGDETIRVSYGIERYYVPEGQGHALEEARSGGHVSVAARVSAAGQVQIRSLLLDGSPVYQEPMY